MLVFFTKNPLNFVSCNYEVLDPTWSSFFRAWEKIPPSTSQVDADSSPRTWTPPIHHLFLIWRLKRSKGKHIEADIVPHYFFPSSARRIRSFAGLLDQFPPPRCRGVNGEEGVHREESTGATPLLGRWRRRRRGEQGGGVHRRRVGVGRGTPRQRGWPPRRPGGRQSRRGHLQHVALKDHSVDVDWSWPPRGNYHLHSNL
jgi:hypothetical protein